MNKSKLGNQELDDELERRDERSRFTGPAKQRVKKQRARQRHRAKRRPESAEVIKDRKAARAKRKAGGRPWLSVIRQLGAN